MKQREIRQLVDMVTTSDGAGVTLKRGIANGALSDLDPFLLFDHFGSANPDEYIAGFPMHPHRGIETVTYMLKGIIKHSDSSGNEGVISAGDVQWMTAGSGIMHEEMPQIREGEMEGFQLWVNLPAKSKMMQPRYQDYLSDDIPVYKTEDGTEIKVIAGEVEGVEGVITGIEASPTYLDVKLSEGASFRQNVAAGHEGFAYLFEGDADFTAKDGDASDNERAIATPKIIVFEDGDFIDVKAGKDGARFLLVSGAPLNEPISRYGPFVMNTREEIQEALSDLQRGTFVKSYE